MLTEEELKEAQEIVDKWLALIMKIVVRAKTVQESVMLVGAVVGFVQAGIHDEIQKMTR
jgi:hypothetical protein